MSNLLLMLHVWRSHTPSPRPLPRRVCGYMPFACTHAQLIVRRAARRLAVWEIEYIQQVYSVLMSCKDSMNYQLVQNAETAQKRKNIFEMQSRIISLPRAQLIQVCGQCRSPWRLLHHVTETLSHPTLHLVEPALLHSPTWDFGGHKGAKTEWWMMNPCWSHEGLRTIVV